MTHSTENTKSSASMAEAIFSLDAAIVAMARTDDRLAREALGREAIAQLGAMRALLDKAVQSTHNWCEPPEKCPITRRPFFMALEHPTLGLVPTYGGPYDSYTIPVMQGDPADLFHERELVVHRYDHDEGSWVDDEIVPLRVITEEVLWSLEQPHNDTAQSS